MSLCVLSDSGRQYLVVNGVDDAVAVTDGVSQVAVGYVRVSGWAPAFVALQPASVSATSSTSVGADSFIVGATRVSGTGSSSAQNATQTGDATRQRNVTLWSVPVRAGSGALSGSQNMSDAMTEGAKVLTVTDAAVAIDCKWPVLCLDACVCVRVVSCCI